MNIRNIGMTAMLKFFYMTDRSKMLFDYQGGAQVIYIGRARPGANVRRPVWQITKWTYNAAGNVLAVRYAGGSDSFAFRWKIRTTYTYS